MGTLTLSPRLFDDAAIQFDEPAARTLPHEHPGLPLERPAPSPERRPDPEGGSTLEDVIVAAWEQIEVGAPASCPVCHGRLRAVWSGGPSPASGRCQDCGSHLS